MVFSSVRDGARLVILEGSATAFETVRWAMHPAALSFVTGEALLMSFCILWLLLLILVTVDWFCAR